MALIGGRRRAARLENDEQSGPAPWMVRWFLFGEKPERGTAAWRAYTYARFFSGAAAMHKLFQDHRAALEAAWAEQGQRGKEPYFRGIYT